MKTTINTASRMGHLSKMASTAYKALLCMHPKDNKNETK